MVSVGGGAFVWAVAPAASSPKFPFRCAQALHVVPVKLESARTKQIFSDVISIVNTI